jgi:DNA-directed RNA polymerase specialized sigma24 family protein
MDDTHKKGFSTTQWTLVARLHSSDGEVAGRALDELCTQYHYPLYCYIRCQGLNHHDAQDALHDFMAKLLRLESFKKADAGKGRLRFYLITALQRFLINWRRNNKHRMQEPSIEAEAERADTEGRYHRERFSDNDTPERIFERKWSLELLSHVFEKLGGLYRNKGREALFKTLRPVLLAGGSLRGEDRELMAASLGMSEGALRVALSRMLKDYGAVLREEVRQTVAIDEDVDDEIAYLQQIFHKP